MIAFIDDHRITFGVEPICKVLPIAPSTYHAQAARRRDPAKLPAQARRDAALMPEIVRVFEENFRVYGVRKGERRDGWVLGSSIKGLRILRLIDMPPKHHDFSTLLGMAIVADFYIGPKSPPLTLDIHPRRIYIRYGHKWQMAKRTSPTYPPLTPAVLHILLALSRAEMHGYGIMKQVEADSQSKVKMGPGTLYGSLGRMMEAGLISESDKKMDPRLNDERRVYYRITGQGRRVLAAELDRYRAVVALTEQNRPLPDTVAYGV